MKKLLFAFTISVFVLSCGSTGSLSNIVPKTGTLELPQKGELRMWKGISHPSFNVTLTNPSATQSCELYTVKSNGSEKWISPSLQAGKSISITIPANGHLFIKNFNPNVLTISYKIEE